MSYSLNAPYAAQGMDLNTGNSGISLQVVQNPECGRVAGGKDKDRKPIDPPPMLRLAIDEKNFDRNSWGRLDAVLQNPFFFVTCRLMNAKPNQDVDCNKALLGNTVSSLSKLKDQHGAEGGWFIFSDLSVKNEGVYTLQFSLYELRGEEAVLCTSVDSRAFTVHTQRSFPGLRQSTPLTRHMSDQGVRLRLRKDSRTATNRQANIRRAVDLNHKRGYGSEDFRDPKRQRPSYPNMPAVPTPDRTAATTTMGMGSTIATTIATTMGLQSPLQGRTSGYPDYETFTSPGGGYNSPYLGDQSYSAMYPHYTTSSGIGSGYGMAPLTPSTASMTSQTSVTQSPPMYSQMNPSGSQYSQDTGGSYVDFQWKPASARPSPPPGMTGLATPTFSR